MWLPSFLYQHKKMTTPTYRTLTEADTVQEGDEFQIVSTGRWHPVAYSIGDRGDSNYRRRIAAEAPCICESNDVRVKRLDAAISDAVEQRAQNRELIKRLEDALSDKVIAQATLEDKKAVIRRLKEKLENVEPLFARLTAAEKRCERHRTTLQQIHKALPVELQNSGEPFGDTVSDHIEALSAAQVLADYFFTLLTDIGSMFGLRASISEEGSICDHIIVEKIPELVAELIVKNETL